MKKSLIILLILIGITAQGQEGQLNFKIQSNHYYEFKISLRENAQYKFSVTGDNLFWFKIIEPSGNEWEQQRALFTNTHTYTLVVYENIMDSGSYTIRIYSITDNSIKLTWSKSNK